MGVMMILVSANFTSNSYARRSSSYKITFSIMVTVRPRSSSTNKRGRG